MLPIELCKKKHAVRQSPNAPNAPHLNPAPPAEHDSRPFGFSAAHPRHSQKGWAIPFQVSVLLLLRDVC